MDSPSTVDIDELLTANLPDAALVSQGSASNEDERIQAAAAAAIQQGTTRPLVKEELRQTIMLKRMKAGKPELKPEFSAPKKFELTAAEKVRKERRREQNRRAAKKCRDKKKTQQSGVYMRYEKTKRENQQLRAEVRNLLDYEMQLKMALLNHSCIQNLPCTQIQGQTGHQDLCPQQDLQQQLHQEQQQQLQDQGYSSPVTSTSSNIPETVMPETIDVDAEQPMLGSQGFDSIYPSLHSQDLRLDSQELDAVIRNLANDQNDIPEGAAGNGLTPASAVPQETNGPPFCLTPSTITFVYQPEIAPHCPMTTACLSQPVSTVLPTSANTDQNLQSSSLRAGHQASFASVPSAAASCSAELSEDPALDLPGFPFSIRRKRKSADSVCHTGQGESSQPKIPKSATCPSMSVQAASGHVVNMPSGNHDVSRSSQNVTFGLGCANGPPDAVIPFSINDPSYVGGGNSAHPHSTTGTQLHPLQPTNLNLPTCQRVAGGSASFQPSTSPSPRSPCCWPFSVTPPPRCSITPPPISPVTPPPSSSSLHAGSTQALATHPYPSLIPLPSASVTSPPPSYCSPGPSSTRPFPPTPGSASVSGFGREPAATVSANLAPVGQLDLTNVADQEVLQYGQGIWSTPGDCNEDVECLSSRSLHDMLLNGFTSSQED